jgi:phosphatidate cytidylyltransferase
VTNLLSRLAIAVAGLPIVIGAAYVGGWFLTIVALVAGLVALHEFYSLAFGLRPLVLAGYGGATGAILGAQLGDATWMVGGFLVVFPLSFLFAAIAETRQSTTVAIATTVFGTAWIGLGLAQLVLLRRLGEDASDAILAVLFTVFATDTFAYLGGRLAGRHRMSPVMSPGKTWEGFVVGALAGIGVAFLVLYESAWSGADSLVFGAVVVLASTIGDLFESLVKRDLGAKDTGRILLGHGGVLDRIDSLLFAGPAGLYILLALS